jgi:hypothetical protein
MFQKRSIDSFFIYGTNTVMTFTLKGNHILKVTNRPTGSYNCYRSITTGKGEEMTMNQPHYSYPSSPQLVALVDPYVYQTLQSIVGREVVVETARGSVQGVLREARPDHIILSSNRTTLFIRIQQIVWIRLTN